MPAAPTPAGVPVEIMSPGSNVTKLEMNATTAATGKTISAVLAFCLTSPLTLSVICNCCGSRSSSAGRTHGPHRTEGVTVTKATCRGASRKIRPFHADCGWGSDGTCGRRCHSRRRYSRRRIARRPLRSPLGGCLPMITPSSSFPIDAVRRDSRDFDWLSWMGQRRERRFHEDVRERFVPLFRFATSFFDVLGVIPSPRGAILMEPGSGPATRQPKSAAPMRHVGRATRILNFFVRVEPPSADARPPGRIGAAECSLVKRRKRYSRDRDSLLWAAK